MLLSPCSKPRTFGVWFLLLLVTGGLAGCRGDRPSESGELSPTPLETPKLESTWFYQLQNLDHQELLDTSAALMVIDPSRGGDGDSAGFWTSQEIAALSAQGKVVLSYLSIGEAEEYRDYWQANWNDSPPKFLHRANPNYTNNYLVRYWLPEWKAIVRQRLVRDVANGFNGVYLDKVDAFDDWMEADPSLDPDMLKQEMAQFISELRAAGDAEAEKRGGHFVLYLQNSGDLWQAPGLTGKIDGLAVEEFSLGWENQDGVRTPSEVRLEMKQHLEEAHKAGVTTLVIDYPDKSTRSEQRAEAIEDARRVGALPLLAPRSLDGDSL